MDIRDKVDYIRGLYRHGSYHDFEAFIDQNNMGDVDDLIRYMKAEDDAKFNQMIKDLGRRYKKRPASPVHPSAPPAKKRKKKAITPPPKKDISSSSEEAIRVDDSSSSEDSSSSSDGEDHVASSSSDGEDHADSSSSKDEDDDTIPIKDFDTEYPSLSKTKPYGTVGRHAANSISHRRMRVRELNQKLKTGYETMKNHILRVGKLGDYHGGRHRKNVRLTLHIVETDKNGFVEDEESLSFANFNADHIANLLRFRFNDEFKEIADLCSVSTTPFTEEELRTGVDVHKPRKAAKIALAEFKARNGGHSPIEVYGKNRKGEMNDPSEFHENPRRIKGQRTIRRKLDRTDCPPTESDSDTE